MASISKLLKTKDGRRYWRIQVSRGKGVTAYSTNFYWPVGKNGSPVAESTASRKLEAAAAEFELKCKNGEYQNRQEIKEKQAEEDRQRAELKTFKQYAESVYMATKRLSLAKNTLNSYESTINLHLNPVLGETLMVDISSAMINGLLLSLQAEDGKGFHTARICYNVLNGVFKMAYLDDSIPKNPMDKVTKPKRAKDATIEKETDKALDLDTLLYVLDCVKNEDIKWQAYINLSADTGARRGELVGLKWSDIDFDKETITIERNSQYTPGGGTYIASPKNGKRRVIDIGSETAMLLKRLEAEQKEERKRRAKRLEKEHKPLDINKVGASEYVFTEKGYNSPMFPQTPTRYFQKFGEKYGIENFHPHLLRHTFASLAITEANADIVSVSARLGHSDTAITLRMYAHATDESVRRAGQGLRDALELRKAQNMKKAEGQ